MMVQLGLAVRTTAFREGKELSEPIKITKPGRIFSMDETRLTNDATTCSKAKANRSVIGKDGDCGEVIVNKGGGNGTGIGDTSADGLDLPGFFIFANNIIHAGENDKDVWLRTTVPLVGGRTPTTLASQCRVAFGRMQRGASRSTSASATFKGAWNRASWTCRRKTLSCSSWMGTDRTSRWSCCITAGRAGCIEFCARHTTHVLQGEDIQRFAIIKPKYLRAKYTLTAAWLLLGESRLTAGDLLLYAKEAWQEAFNLEHSLKAWAKVGVSPFTRCV